VTSHKIIFQPEAIIQLQGLQDFIAANASPAIAARYVAAIFDQCEALRDFPHRGTQRDDVRLGLRTLSHRGRALIVFTVGTDRVDILGVFYGGQNWELTFAD